MQAPPRHCHIQAGEQHTVLVRMTALFAPKKYTSLHDYCSTGRAKQYDHGDLGQTSQCTTILLQRVSLCDLSYSRRGLAHLLVAGPWVLFLQRPESEKGGKEKATAEAK